jgi:hypothetical protein
MIPHPSACPLHYRYRASDFRNASALAAETVYVVGGLYGNVEALHTLLRMQEEERRQGTPVTLLFNGDHNWFDIDATSFCEINQTVLEHAAIQGNVEAEIAAPSAGGCGCSYPAYVDAGLATRSDAIMVRLQETSAVFPWLRKRLGELPRFGAIEVGGERVGIVHGDAESLSGWSFAAESLSSAGQCHSGDAGETTPLATLERYFREAGVCAFASSHTCLPFARDYEVDGKARLVINNGAAGMPNFARTAYGVITRISVHKNMPRTSLYGLQLGGLRFDALPVHYDQAKWVKRFLANWPPGSPAYESYYRRIAYGPEYALDNAVAGNVR